MDQETIHRLMIRGARRGKRVVRLKGGDPFVFGRGGEEALALRAAGLAFEVDHRNDPDWRIGGRAPQATRAAKPPAPTPVAPAYEPPAVESQPEETWDLGALDEPRLEIDAVEAPSVGIDAALSIELPQPRPLSEPVRVTDLFDDPSIEVARLAAGERREILIPVELAEGAAKKRFTLAIQLRLDPVD